MRLPAAALLTVLAVAPVAAQEQVAGEKTFSERISVMAVEIPVRVVSAGRPVAGLTADSFRVLEGGREHEIVAFEVLDLTRTGPVEPEATAQRAAGAPLTSTHGRRLLLVFDTAYSSRKHLFRAVKATRQLVEKGLHPSDRVAVAVYSEMRGLRFVTGFTPDREVTVLALDAFGAGLGGDKKEHRQILERLARRPRAASETSALDRFRRLTAQFGRSAAIAFESAEADLGLGGGGIGESFFDPLPGARFSALEPPRDPVLSGFQNTDPGQITAGLARGPGRSGVRALSLELVEMATVLRDLPGQKHLFLLSQGFSARLLEDVTALHHLEKALEALRRASWAIQAIDIEGVPEMGVAGFGAHSLFYLANETGGELLENHNDLELAATKLVERTAVSYVLTIQPTGVLADGRYHPLQVRLRDGGPRGARIIHRPGYYAPKPFGQRNDLENALDAAELLLSRNQRDELEVSVLAFPLFAGELTQVPVVVEIAASELGTTRRGSAALEFHGYALDEEGAIQDLFSRRLRLSRDEVGRLQGIGGGIRFYDRVALPAGRHTLRLLVRDLRTGEAFLSSLPLTIPGSSAEPLLHRPLFVVDDGWTVLRGQGNLNGGSGLEHPFVVAGRPRIPKVQPVLEPGESATVLLRVEHLAAPDLRLRARILDAGGTPVTGGALTFSQRVMSAEEGLEALLGTFTASELAPGSYRLEVTASWDRGRRESTAASEFRVAGRVS